MKAIYERELKSYFYSMTGYVFIAFVTMFIGIYFMVYNMINGYPYFSYTLSSTLMILMIAVPILTMRSMSDERRSRTDQMLLTAPRVCLGHCPGKIPFHGHHLRNPHGHCLPLSLNHQGKRHRIPG